MPSAPSARAIPRPMPLPPPVTTATRPLSSAIIVDDDFAAGGNRLAGENPSLRDLVRRERVVDAHPDLSLGEVGHAGRTLARLAGERRLQPRTPGGLQNGIARLVLEAM